MADKITLTIVAPDRVLFRGTVEDVYVPGFLGEFGVLEGHSPFFCEMEPGRVHYKTGNEEKAAAVAEGFAIVSDDKVTLLVEAAEYPSEIDAKKAEQYRLRAEEKLKDLTLFDSEYRFWELRLKRAMNRLAMAQSASA